MDSRRAAEGFGTKNKKDNPVRGCHFLSGKPFSNESDPDFMSCVVHTSAKTNAGRYPGWTGRLAQFKLSVGQYPTENHRLGIALPELYLKDLP